MNYRNEHDWIMPVGCVSVIRVGNLAFTEEKTGQMALLNPITPLTWNASCAGTVYYSWLRTRNCQLRWYEYFCIPLLSTIILEWYVSILGDLSYECGSKRMFSNKFGVFVLGRASGLRLSNCFDGYLHLETFLNESLRWMNAKVLSNNWCFVVVDRF